MVTGIHTWAPGSFLPRDACVGDDCGAGEVLPGARLAWGRKVWKKFLEGVVMLTLRWLDTRSLWGNRWNHTHTRSLIITLTSLPFHWRSLLLISFPLEKETLCDESQFCNPVTLIPYFNTQGHSQLNVLMVRWLQWWTKDHTHQQMKSRANYISTLVLFTSKNLSVASS